jgi:tetratricopeptide (TPR) repeat protein
MTLMMFRHSEAPRHTGGGEPTPDSATSLAREAALFASRNEYRRALSYYGRALLLDDSRAVLWFNYANVQLRLGMKDDAIDSFEFALRLDPALFAARYSLANLLVDMGQPLAGMRHYEEVIAQNPTYAPAWRNLGRILCALGRLDQAEASLREAVRCAPHDQETAALLEEIMEEKRNPAEN